MDNNKIEIPKQLKNESFRFCLLKHKEKVAIEKDWNNTNNYPYNHPRLLKHLENGGNYGVIGGYGNLIIIDSDSKEVTEISNKLSNTFIIKTGSKEEYKKHYYFTTEKEMQPIRLSKNGVGDLGDIRSKGQYVVGPNCIHPSGGIYRVINDYPITFTTSIELKNSLGEISQKESSGKRGFLIDTTKRSSPYIDKCRVPDYLINETLPQGTSKNFILMPLITDILYNRGVAINVFEKIAAKQATDGSDGVQAVKGWLKTAREGHLMKGNCKKMQEYLKKFHPGRIDEICGNCPLNQENKPKIEIRLPQTGQSFSDFINNIVSGIDKNDSALFYRPRLNCIVENTNWEDKILNQQIDGLRDVKIPRLINLLEEKFKFYTRVVKDDGFVRVYKELSKKWAELLMENTNFLNALPVIDRYFTCPIPYKINDKLILPKKGWDFIFDSFLVKDSPDIEEMSVKEAKETISKPYDEFCFKDEQDKINAISHLITPACRGLYSSPTARTPFFFYMANRERCGKDYCAGIVSIVYEGFACDNPPVSTDERNSGNSEELRKKLTSSMKRGVRLLHFSNNRGKINNAVLEQALTSEHWMDRLLGGNTEILLNNEVDFSASANMGVSCTPDLSKRSLRVNLFYAEEDINKREFKTPNLHEIIIINRGKILSAIYTLIKTWVEAGEPSDCVNSSFHEWARVVGGIMTYHELGDPTVESETEDDLTFDTETTEMRDLFIYMATLHPKDESGQVEIKNSHLTIGEIIDEVKNGQNVGETFFSDLELEKPGDRVRLAIKIRKFLGRELSSIKFKVFSKNKRKNRETYIFEKSGLVGMVGGSVPMLESREEGNIHKGRQTAPTRPSQPPTEEIIVSESNNQDKCDKKVTKTISEPTHQPQKKRPKTEQMNWLDLWIPKDDTKSEISIIDLIDSGVTQEQIDEYKAQNIIFEPKSGFIMRF